MSTEEKSGNGGGNGGERFTFSVDSRPYESDVPVLTGVQLKNFAKLDPAFLLFLEGRGGDSDRQIDDATSVDLRDLPGREQFYSAPPATFGGGDMTSIGR